MSKTVSGSAEPYVWDTADGLPAIIRDGAVNYVIGLGGLPLEQINGSVVTYYHQDQLGSTRALTNASGVVVASYGFDAYGNAVGAPPAFANPFGFGGQYTDSESGLEYLAARYYDPTTGGLLSRDPIVASSRQPYVYVSGDPVNMTDPTGLFGLDDLKHLAGKGFRAAAHAVYVAHELAVGAVEGTADAAYLPYFGAYQAMKAVNDFGDHFGPLGTAASRTVTTPLLVPEAIGLAADVTMDLIKNTLLGNHESPCDEGNVAPRLGNWAKNHGIYWGKMYFPGVHSDGNFEWEW